MVRRCTTSEVSNGSGSGPAQAQSSSAARQRATQAKRTARFYSAAASARKRSREPGGRVASETVTSKSTLSATP